MAEIKLAANDLLLLCFIIMICYRPRRNWKRFMMNFKGILWNLVKKLTQYKSMRKI